MFNVNNFHFCIEKLFDQRFNKIYYLRPLYEMTDFRWFSYKGRLLNFSPFS